MSEKEQARLAAELLKEVGLLRADDEEQAKATMRLAKCDGIRTRLDGVLVGVIEEHGVHLTVYWFAHGGMLPGKPWLRPGWWVGTEHEQVNETSATLVRALLDAVQRRQEARARLRSEEDLMIQVGSSIGSSETTEEVG